MRRLLSVLVFLLCASAISAQTYTPPTVVRSKTQLNGSWKFITSNTLTGAQTVGFDDSGWSTVSVPHTWDTPTSVTSFSNSWYRTHFNIAAGDSANRVYIYFEGANTVADVYVNGTHLGQHRGGYTRFIFDATASIVFGADNVLAVQVSSANCSDCLPDTTPRLWKNYGGIYRKAWIIETNQYHVFPDFASQGLYITPSSVSSASASISIKTFVRNETGVSQTFTVKNFLVDANNNIVLSLQQAVVVAGNTTVNVTQTGTVNNPHLWSNTNPYLYTVNAETWVSGVAYDWVQERTGFRFYTLTSSNFTLNGTQTLLRGIAKHQETEYSATAVADSDLQTDWTNLQDLGVNFVRLVHYPHAQLEYDLADQDGIMVWAEDGHTNSGAHTANGDVLVQEMVFQNWNHPSIIFWSAGNEAPAVSATSSYAAVIKAADTSRPVVYGSNGQSPSNVDFIFQNVYEGWYVGNMYNFPTSGDHWYSESGAGMVVGTHTSNTFAMSFTVNSFEPEEYGTLVNEVKFQSLFVTSPTTVPAYIQWVFREIADVKYKNVLNTKGFLTYSNYKKDIYYLYKSFLKASTPLVHIVGPDYFLRNGGDVKVYSNAANVTLSVNGVTQSTVANGVYKHPNNTVINNVFYWVGVLALGKNVLTADDGLGHRDTLTVYYKGSGTTMPAETKVSNLVSSNSSNPAFFLNMPSSNQLPIFYDFDSTGDNTFDVVPAILIGAGRIATKRQSNSSNTTNLTFDLTTGGTVYIMFTNQGAVPAWITSAGFTDTGVTGKWRDNNLTLVNYQLFQNTYTAGAHVVLGSSAIDFAVFVGLDDGLFIPTTHPRIWFNQANLQQARNWYTTHPFTPTSTGDERFYLQLGAHYLMTGTVSDCTTVINNALAQTYTDAQLQTAGPDGPRQNGDAVIVAAFDWCNNQLTAAQQSTLLTNWNHYISVLDASHGLGQWGGPDMQFSNYNWGYIRNNTTWGIAINDQDQVNSKAWLDNGLATRWTGNFVPLTNTAGPKGGLGGMPQEGSEYGPYLGWYSIFPFVTANQMGRDVYNENNFFLSFIYWLIYDTPLAKSETKNWQPISWADDEQWVNGNELLRGNYYPDFMTSMANYYTGTNVSQYARQWLAMTGATANQWVAALDNGGPSASFSALPLDYFAPGYQQMFGRSVWNAANAHYMWQLGAPKGVGHNHHDWGSFQIWKNGTWLSRESVGYAQSVAGFGGSGSQSVTTAYPHNSILFGGSETTAGSGNISVSRLESQLTYAYAATDLGLTSPQGWVRELIFVRDLETTVILDRLNTNNATTSTTFLLHAETNPTLEDTQHITITNGAEALRMTMLQPSAPSFGVVTEGGPGQFRIEATNSNPGNVLSYFLTVLQAKDVGASNISPSVVDSVPADPTSGTFTVTLDANHSMVFNKGATSSGGTITINSTLVNLRGNVAPIAVSTSGVVWNGVLPPPPPPNPIPAPGSVMFSGVIRNTSGNIAVK